MKTGALAMLAVVLCFLAGEIAAADACMCRANGERFELGSIVCLKLPSGERLARCGKVLNNTSWTLIGDDCPLTSADPKGSEPALPTERG